MILFIMKDSNICFNCWKTFTHKYDVLYCSRACREEAKASDHDAAVRHYINELRKEERILEHKYFH